MPTDPVDSDLHLVVTFVRDAVASNAAVMRPDGDRRADSYAMAGWPTAVCSSTSSIICARPTTTSWPRLSPGTIRDLADRNVDLLRSRRCPRHLAGVLSQEHAHDGGEPQGLD